MCYHIADIIIEIKINNIIMYASSFPHFYCLLIGPILTGWKLLTCDALHQRHMNAYRAVIMFSHSRILFRAVLQTQDFFFTESLVLLNLYILLSTVIPSGTEILDMTDYTMRQLNTCVHFLHHRRPQNYENNHIAL